MLQASFEKVVIIFPGTLSEVYVAKDPTGDDTLSSTLMNHNVTEIESHASWRNTCTELTFPFIFDILTSHISHCVSPYGPIALKHDLYGGAIWSVNFIIVGSASNQLLSYQSTDSITSESDHYVLTFRLITCRLANLDHGAPGRGVSACMLVLYNGMVLYSEQNALVNA